MLLYGPLVQYRNPGSEITLTSEEFIGREVESSVTIAGDAPGVGWRRPDRNDGEQRHLCDCCVVPWHRGGCQKEKGSLRMRNLQGGD